MATEIAERKTMFLVSPQKIAVWPRTGLALQRIVAADIAEPVV